MKRPSFLNKHRTNNNGYELNTSTSSSSSDTPNNNTNNKEEKEVVFNSIAVLCHESKSHSKKNTNRSSSQGVSNRDVVSSKDVIISQPNCGELLPSTFYPSSSDFTDTNADELVLNSTTILNNISLEDSYSTSEEAKEVLPSSVAVFVDDLILCGDNSCNKQSKKKKSASVQQANEKTKGVGEVDGGGVSPTNVAEFNVSFGSADFDYFVGNRFTDLSAGKETEHEEKKTEKKTSESSNKETNESSNNKKADNVRYTMADTDKTDKGGKMMRKKEGNNNTSSLADFSNTYNNDTFSISLASTKNSNDASSYTQHERQASIESGVSSASQQYINEHIQILLDTILLPTSMLVPKSVKKEVSNTILPAFKSTANDVTNNIELILTLPADYIVNALNTSASSNDEMKKKVDGMDNVSSFMNSVNAGYESVSKQQSRNISKSSLLNESNISNETIKTSNLLLCGGGSGSSCIERDFLYNTCVDQ